MSELKVAPFLSGDGQTFTDTSVVTALPSFERHHLVIAVGDVVA